MDIEPLSLTLHGPKHTLYPPPVQCRKITRSAISRKPINQNKKKKMMFWRIYFYTSILVLDLKIKIQMAENRLTFWTCVKSTLNGPPNGPVVTYSKIQNRLSRPP